MTQFASTEFLYFSFFCSDHLYMHIKSLITNLTVPNIFLGESPSVSPTHISCSFGDREAKFYAFSAKLASGLIVHRIVTYGFVLL